MSRLWWLGGAINQQGDTRGITVVVSESVSVITFGGGVTVEEISLVAVTVMVVEDVVDVTIVEVESVVTITGSCVKVMIAKKAWPGGLITSD